MWKRLHWTTRRDLKLAFWVMLFAAPVLVFVLWDDTPTIESDFRHTAVSGDTPRKHH